MLFSNRCPQKTTLVTEGTRFVDSSDYERSCAQGIAWVNGFNLGWYWPARGPQVTLFIPGPLLRRGDNEIVLLEMDRSPSAPSGERISLMCIASLQYDDVMHADISSNIL